jgi:tetratricopeptide (TPR) repeat protein
VAARLRTDDAVESFLAALDGERTLWQALQEASTPRSRAAAWLLDASGAVTYADRAVNPTASGVPSAQVEIVVDEPRSQAPARAAQAGRSAEAQAERGKKAAVLQREVSEIHDRLEDLDWYQLLGVAPDASTAEIKRAYLEAAKHYHPDALSRLGLDAEARVKANQIFAEIGTAYATLTDPGQRRDYDASLRGEAVGIDAEQLVNAEVLFRKGEVLLRLGNFKGALEFLAPAVELWPAEAAYQSALGWAYHKKIPSEPERAIPHLEEAARLDPDDPVVLFRLGTALRAVGEDARGAELLARANEFDRKTAR